MVERVERAVLLAPVDFAVERKHPTFEEVADLSGFSVTVGDALGLLRKQVAHSVYYGAGNPGRMPQEEADRLEEILRCSDTRLPAQAMIRQAVPFTSEERPDWPRIERLTEAGYVKTDRPDARAYDTEQWLLRNLPIDELAAMPMKELESKSEFDGHWTKDAIFITAKKIKSFLK